MGKLRCAAKPCGGWFYLWRKREMETEGRRCVLMRKKLIVLLAAVMTLLTAVSPAIASPPDAADFGLHTAHHEAIPEGVPGHEHVPHPS